MSPDRPGPGRRCQEIALCVNRRDPSRDNTSAGLAGPGSPFTPIITGHRDRHTPGRPGDERGAESKLWMKFRYTLLQLDLPLFPTTDQPSPPRVCREFQRFFRSIGW